MLAAEVLVEVLVEVLAEVSWTAVVEAVCLAAALAGSEDLVGPAEAVSLQADLPLRGS